MEKIYNADEIKGFISDEYSDAHILCANCHFPNTHIDGFKPLRDGDEGIEIVFWCEGCPKKFSLVIRFHEGFTYIEFIKNR